jgi:hypothetical protein
LLLLEVHLVRLRLEDWLELQLLQQQVLLLLAELEESVVPELSLMLEVWLVLIVLMELLLER